MKCLTVCILVLALLTLNTLNTQPTVAQTVSPALLCTLGTDKDKVRHEKGAKVGARIRELRKYNKNVDQALAAFERNGTNPRIDEAESFIVEADAGTAAIKESTFRNVGYKPQSSGYLSAIVITAYEAPAEWQGTVIYQQFSSSGGYLREYIADLIIRPDSTGAFTDVTLEVSYEDVAYLEYGTASMYYGLGTGYSQASNKPGSIFKKASFQVVTVARVLFRRVVQNPRVRSYVRCVWVGSGTGALGCAAGSAAFAETPFVPCLLIVGTGVNSYCAFTTIFP